MSSFDEAMTFAQRGPSGPETAAFDSAMDYATEPVPVADRLKGVIGGMPLNYTRSDRAASIQNISKESGLDASRIMGMYDVIEREMAEATSQTHDDKVRRAASVLGKTSLTEFSHKATIVDLLAVLPFSPVLGYEKTGNMEAKYRAETGKHSPVPTYGMSPMGGFRMARPGVTGTQLQDIITEYDIEQERGMTLPHHIFKGISQLPAYITEFATGGKMIKPDPKIASLVTKVAAAFGNAGILTAIQPHRVTAAMADQINAGNSGPRSVFMAYGDVYIENISEMAGEAFPVVGKAMLQKLPFGGKLLAGMQKHAASKGIPEAKFWDIIGTREGWNGLASEWTEERLATILRGAVGVNDFGAGPDALYYERIAAGLQQDLELRNQLVEGAVLMTPAGVNMLGKSMAKRGLMEGDEGVLQEALDQLEEAVSQPPVEETSEGEAPAPAEPAKEATAAPSTATEALSKQEVKSLKDAGHALPDILKMEPTQARALLEPAAEQVQESAPEPTDRGEQYEKTRRSELGKTTRFIKKHPIYVSLKEGLEDAAYTGAGEVRVYIPKEYNGDVEAYAGEKGRKRGLWSMITNDPEKGMPWDTMAQERGWGEDFDTILGKLQQVYENRQRGALNEAAFEKAVESQDVELEVVAMKRNLLENGESIEDINSAIQDYVNDFSDVDQAGKDAIIDTHTIKEKARVEKRKTTGKRVPGKAKADTGLFGQTQIRPSTGKKQGQLGLELEPVAREAVPIKPELASAVAKNAGKYESAKDLYAGELTGRNDLFNDETNPLPEIQEAWDQAEKGGRLFGEAEKGEGQWGDANKGVSREAYDAIIAKRKKGGKLPGGRSAGGTTLFSAEEWSDMVKVGRFHIEAGARAFADWAARMTADFGAAIQPYLRDLWVDSQLVAGLKQSKEKRRGVVAQQKKERRRRAGSYEGTLKWLMEKKRLPAEEAIDRATAMWSGPLTEYQKYDGLDEFLSDDVKADAYTDIATTKKLGPYERKNTSDAFRKLWNGIVLTPYDVKMIKKWRPELFEEAQKRVSKTQWIFDQLEQLLGVLKYPAGFDVQMRRQARWMRARHPKLFVQSIGRNIGGYMSERYADRLAAEVSADPGHDEARAHGVVFLERHGKAAEDRPEQFVSYLGEKIPITGRAYAASMRGFIDSFNWMQQALWNYKVAAWENQGREITDKMLDDLADFNNTFLGMSPAKTEFGRAARRTFRPIMWSPTLTVSRLRTPGMILTNPTMRTETAVSLSAHIGTGIMYMAAASFLADWLGRAIGKEVDVEWDPFHSDFGKVQVGHTRVDVFGDAGPYIRAFLQATFAKKRNQAGRMRHIPRLEPVKQLMRNKRAPFVDLISRVWTGRKFYGSPAWATPDWGEMKEQGGLPALLAKPGEKITESKAGEIAFHIGKEVLKTFTPFFVNGTIEAGWNDGWMIGMWAGAEEFFSGSTLSYKPSTHTQLQTTQDIAGVHAFDKLWDDLSPSKQAELRGTVPEINDLEERLAEERTPVDEISLSEQNATAKRITRALPDDVRKAMQESGERVKGLSRRVKGFWLTEERYKEYANRVTELTERNVRYVIENGGVMEKAVDAARAEAKARLIEDIERGKL